MPTKEELKELRSKSLAEKIQISTARIIEWYENWGGQVYVSNSGGIDSCVLSDLVHKIYPEVPDVFVDTGLEYPELRDFILSKPSVEVIKPKVSFKEILTKYGYPVISKKISRDVGVAKHCPKGKTALRFDENSEYSIKYGSRYSNVKWKFLIDAPFRTSDRCCLIMKKTSAKHYEKETGRYGYVGTMTEESSQRETVWEKQGCNAFNAKRPISAPLSFWTKNDILEYVVKNNLPYASVYGDIVFQKGKYKTTGCQRTGCVWCAYGAQADKKENKFQRLAKTHPQLWDYCMRGGKFDEEGMWIPDKGLGMAYVLDYINIKWWNDGDEEIRDKYRKEYTEKGALICQQEKN